MKDIVVIKLYRPEIENCDYHDLFMEDADNVLKELKSYEKKFNKTIIFTACQALDIANFDSFAEITYSGTITEEEKKIYIDIIKKFSNDATISGRTMNVEALNLTVVFKRCESFTDIKTFYR